MVSVYRTTKVRFFFELWHTRWCFFFSFFGSICCERDGGKGKKGEEGREVVVGKIMSGQSGEADKSALKFFFLTETVIYSAFFACITTKGWFLRGDLFYTFCRLWK